MTRSLFFTNHLKVLALLSARPDLRLSEVADQVGITDRAAHRIISELVEAGYLLRERRGARNHYTTLKPPQIADGVAGVIRQAIGFVDHDASFSSNGSGDAGRFRAIFDAIPTGVMVVSDNGKIVVVNRALCEILGRPAAELVGRSVLEHTHPDDVSTDEEQLTQLVNGGQPKVVREKRYIRGDGSIVSVSIRVAPLLDRQTGKALLVSHVAEPGRTVRHDQDLAEAEERFRSAFDNAPIGMALLAPDGRWLKVNRAVSVITGYSETALLTRTFQDITHPDDLDTNLKHMRRMLAGEVRSYSTDKRYRHADGRFIWVSLSVSLIRDAAGKPLYFISQFEDISRRRAAEESTRRVVDRIAEAVSIIDRNGVEVHVNPASRGIRDDLRERFDHGPLADLEVGAITLKETPVPKNQLPAEITRLTGDEIDDLVLGFPSRTEPVRWLRMSTRRLSDGPPPYEVVLSYTDVTRAMQAERALAVSEARLQALFRNIPAALSLRDLDGRYLEITEPAARALGHTPEEMVGRHPSQHLDAETTGSNRRRRRIDDDGR